jgi:hypothetical protein
MRSLLSFAADDGTSLPSLTNESPIPSGNLDSNLVVSL